MAGLSKVDGGKIRVYANGELKVVNGENSLPTGIRSVDAYVKSFIEEFGGEVKNRKLKRVIPWIY